MGSGLDKLGSQLVKESTPVEASSEWRGGSREGKDILMALIQWDRDCEVCIT